MLGCGVLAPGGLLVALAAGVLLGVALGETVGMTS
jgi:hypothetical protein